MISSLSQIYEIIDSFLKGEHTEKKPPLLVLLGPTASGKTALSLELAAHFNGEVVSADSRQIYKKMDIATDKILPEAQKGIPHFLLNMAEPDERFTVTDFKREATAVIKDIHARGKLPMIVGGTGFYIDAVVDDFEIPPQNMELRKKIEEELAEKGAEKMHEKLKELDPNAAAKIHPNNNRYLIRALEIALHTGKPRGPHKKPAPLNEVATEATCRSLEREGQPYKTLKIGLRWPKEVMIKRIHLRVDEQIKRGLIEETQKLLDAGYSPDLPSMTSLGYKEIVAYLNKEISLEEATNIIKVHTQQYAKRQLTWFKRDPDIIWFELS